MRPIEHTPAGVSLPGGKDGSVFALTRNFGVWELVYAGRRAWLKEERGLTLVACLLARKDGQPIHALDLAAQVSGQRSGDAAGEVLDPATGRKVVLDREARVQERSLRLDDAAARRNLLQRMRELQGVFDDDHAPEPAKLEAEREWEEIAEFLRRDSGSRKESAARAADTVRKAIRRFHSRLERAQTRDGTPHPVLAEFAAHLHRYLLVPSRRGAAGGNGHSSTGLGGCLVYEPPPGVRWRVEM